MHPKEIKDAYDRGENIMALLKKTTKIDRNTLEIIETAYDLQTGSYVKTVQEPKMKAYKIEYGNGVAQEILSLTTPSSILEAGIGEGTVLSFVLDGFGELKAQIHGVDISWSRLACCRNWLQKQVA